MRFKTSKTARHTLCAGLYVYSQPYSVSAIHFIAVLRCHLLVCPRSSSLQEGVLQYRLTIGTTTTTTTTPVSSASSLALFVSQPGGALGEVGSQAGGVVLPRLYRFPANGGEGHMLVLTVLGLVLCM